MTIPDGSAFTSRLFYPLRCHSPETPLLALWRREQPAEGNAAHTPWLTLTGLTIVLLAQMKLATVSRRNREKGSAGEEEEEKEA